MSLPLNQLSKSFERYLRAEGRSPNTIKVHLAAPDRFGMWLTRSKQPADLDHLTHDNLIGWFADLHATLKPSSVSARYRSMRRFIRWLIAEGELDFNPLAGIAEPTIPHEPVPVLTDSQLTALIKACDGKDFRSRRDETVIRMLLDCGLRVSELCSLTIDSGAGESFQRGNLDLDAGSALITGKGGKVRAVYFGARTERALDRYLRIRQTRPYADLPALFIGQRGAMTTDGIRDMLEKRAAKAGLHDPANPHRFRHTFAHDFLLSGGQERDLKRLAGWSSDVMLERYGASAADARAAAAVKRMRRGDRV